MADERTRLETSDDIQALIGRIVVVPGGGEDASFASKAISAAS